MCPNDHVLRKVPSLILCVNFPLFAYSVKIWSCEKKNVDNRVELSIVFVYII